MGSTVAGATGSSGCPSATAASSRSSVAALTPSTAAWWATTISAGDSFVSGGASTSSTRHRALPGSSGSSSAAVNRRRHAVPGGARLTVTGAGWAGWNRHPAAPSRTITLARTGCRTATASAAARTEARVGCAERVAAATTCSPHGIRSKNSAQIDSVSPAPRSSAIVPYLPGLGAPSHEPSSIG